MYYCDYFYSNIISQLSITWTIFKYLSIDILIESLEAEDVNKHIIVKITHGNHYVACLSYNNIAVPILSCLLSHSRINRPQQLISWLYLCAELRLVRMVILLMKEGLLILTGECEIALVHSHR